MALARGQIHRKHGRCLRQTIAFLNVDACSGKDAGQTRVQGCRTRGDRLGLSSECLLPLGEDQFAGQFELGIIQRGFAAVLVVFCQTYGPEEECFFHARQILALIHDAVVDFFEQARNSGEYLGMNLA